MTKKVTHDQGLIQEHHSTEDPKAWNSPYVCMDWQEHPKLQLESNDHEPASMAKVFVRAPHRSRIRADPENADQFLDRGRESPAVTCLMTSRSIMELR